MYRLRRLIGALALLALVAASCGGDDGDGDPAAAPADDGVVTPDAAESTSTVPTTTAPAPEGSTEIPSLQISRVQFGDDGFVEITNTGDTDADLNGIWLCQFPTYNDLGTVVGGGTVAAGATVQIPAEVTGGLSIDGGEAALYTARDFGNSDAIFGYVQWGSGGGRSDVAAGAGIWPPGASIDPDPEFGNIELFGDPADPESWS